MGRTRRYKKLKAIDPFSKESAAKARAGPEEVSGEVRPPSRNESSRLPRRMQELMRLQQRMAAGNSAAGGGKRTGGGSAADKPKPERLFKHLEALPGESLQAFNRRVKVELRKRVAEIKAAAPAADAKTISDARRAHLEARAEAKKRKKLGLLPGAPLPEDTAAAAEVAQLTGAKRGRGEKDGKSRGGAAAAGGAGGAGKSAAGSTAPAAKRSRHNGDGDAGAGRGSSSSAGGAGAARAGSASEGGGAGKPEPKEHTQRRPAPEEFPTETIAFGERADRPPEIKAVPRKGKVSHWRGARCSGSQQQHQADAARQLMCIAALCCRSLRYLMPLDGRHLFLHRLPRTACFHHSPRLTPQSISYSRVLSSCPSHPNQSPTRECRSSGMRRRSLRRGKRLKPLPTHTTTMTTTSLRQRRSAQLAPPRRPLPLQ